MGNFTRNQILKNYKRQKKIKKGKTPALRGNPQLRGICLKVGTKNPKKPNSADRQVARVKLSTKQRVDCYLPGEGHNIQEYSIILMRGGRLQDVPGVKYHAVRGAFDFNGVKARKQARSKYGTKNPNRKIKF